MTKTKPATGNPKPRAANAKSKAVAKPKPKAKPAAEKRKAQPKRRLPEDFVHIGITPPDLADDSDAQRLDNLLANRDSRPDPLSLAKLPWLKQNIAYRAGYHLMTHGLQEHADHPEIEVCNVPGVLVRPLAQLLNEIADYVLNSGRKLKPGETMSLTPSDDPFLGVLSFRRVRPGKGGMDHERDVFRLVFLR